MIPDLGLIQKKVEILKKILDDYPHLEDYLDDLLDDYNLINVEILDRIIKSVEDEIERLEDIEAKVELEEDIEKLKEAENIEELNKIEEELEQKEEKEEENAPQEYSADDESYSLASELDDNTIGATMTPNDKRHSGYDTFSIEVSPQNQQMIDALVSLCCGSLGIYGCEFEITNDNKYVLSIINNGKGDANNITDLVTMVNSIKDRLTESKMTNIDYFENLPDEYRFLQAKFEQNNLMAKDLYNKSDDHEVAYNQTQRVQTKMDIEDGIEKGNVSVQMGKTDMFTLYNINQEAVLSGSKKEVENTVGASISDPVDSNIKSEQVKTMVKTIGQYPGSGYNGFANISLLIMGLGLAAGLIALFIILA